MFIFIFRCIWLVLNCLTRIELAEYWIKSNQGIIYKQKHCVLFEKVWLFNAFRKSWLVFPSLSALPLRHQNLTSQFLLQCPSHLSCKNLDIKKKKSLIQEDEIALEMVKSKAKFPNVKSMNKLKGYTWLHACMDAWMEDMSFYFFPSLYNCIYL